MKLIGVERAGQSCEMDHRIRSGHEGLEIIPAGHIARHPFNTGRFAWLAALLTAYKALQAVKIVRPGEPFDKRAASKSCRAGDGDRLHGPAYQASAGATSNP